MTLMPVFRNSVAMVLTSNDPWVRFDQVVWEREVQNIFARVVCGFLLTLGQSQQGGSADNSGGLLIL